ncbi:MAG TPA: FAD-dependent oxidoreductase [Henriciella marina]|uniref:FAD-dependent oxidoreductase n=1 Tax=Henriciella sp. TaxID=1968823 RepID=UPI001859D38C|nr:FAD-dependent oxidoreductase [Henriciella sp.]HIG21525.1 FAD-dependent oxidoreductase [Henriciella sp.]HIK64614.1 FAD-dependent oxidoreductase [Henriciella marina]
MTAERASPQTIAIAGAGLIGLSCAFELTERGHDVTLFDPNPAETSTGWAAAGMIAPAYELMLQAGPVDTAFAAFCFESAKLWSGFAQSIKRHTGIPVALSNAPTLALARHADEQTHLHALADVLDELGHRSRRISATTLQNQYGLSPAVESGLQLPDDTHVDNRRVISALRWFFVGQGKVVSAAVETRSKMEELAGQRFDAVIWARGTAETGSEAQVKGQAISLSPVQGQPSTVLRFGARYIVPKADRTIIGATSEPDFANKGVDPAVADMLHEEAARVLPQLAQANRLEHWAGFRPLGTAERPLIGRKAAGEFIATAHYRNGVLLAPATAKLIADQVEGLTYESAYDAFAPAPGSGATA